jgi:hypothetical protein
MHILNNANRVQTYHLSYSTVYEDVYEPTYDTGFVFYDEEEPSSHECDDGFLVLLLPSFSNRQER